MRALFVALVASGLTACSDRAPSVAGAPLPPGVVARVGPELVHQGTVARIAAAQGVDARAALELAVADAVYAVGAGATLGPAVLRHARRIALARAAHRAIDTEVTAEGAPTDAELRDADALEWWAFDRPRLVRVTHAVVVGGEDAAADRLAAQIAAAVAGQGDAARFRAAALAVPAGGLEVRVEDLLPVAPDGRAVDPQHPPPAGSPAGAYDPTFAAAASALTAVGDQSPVVRTQFGRHVLLATGVVPELRLPREELLARLGGQVMEKRAASRRAELLRALRPLHAVQVERAAVDLIDQVQPAP